MKRFFLILFCILMGLLAFGSEAGLLLIFEFPFMLTASIMIGIAFSTTDLSGKSNFADIMLLGLIINFVFAAITGESFFGIFMLEFTFSIILAPFIKNSKNNNIMTPTINAVSYQQPVQTQQTNTNVNVILSCRNCGAQVTVNDKVCAYCKSEIAGDNIVVKENPNPPSTINKFLKPNDFDMMFGYNEKNMVEEAIRRELEKLNITQSNLVPSAELKRLNVLSIIFSLLVFVFISLIFFHFPVATYVIGLLLLSVFYFVTHRYNLTKYLVKQLKSRPDEKISNVVMSTTSTLVKNNSKVIQLASLIVAITIPLIIFSSPRIIYEKTDGGYSVRFYIFGLNSLAKAEIPSEYKGEPVVSLGGNAFSNMFLLKEVKLPDSIKEIRGQAFKNDHSLQSVTLPSNLEYLGGGSFYNCSSLKELIIPDSVTYVGGELCYGCSSLEKVKLSINQPEIRGNSFEECYSLKEIEIPDKVTRIGGHAFYGCTSLEKVEISENSSLKEIGSSAFRQCDSLHYITLPKGTTYSFRSFKESPTVVKFYGELEEEDNY